MHGCRVNAILREVRRLRKPSWDRSANAGEDRAVLAYGDPPRGARDLGDDGTRAVSVNIDVAAYRDRIRPTLKVVRKDPHGGMVRREWPVQRRVRWKAAKPHGLKLRRR